MLDWDLPSKTTMATMLMADPVATVTLLKATVNEASKTAEPAIRSCTNCNLTSTVTLIEKGTGALPDFMAFDVNTLVLTVTPVNSSQMTGASKPLYTLEMTQVT